MTSSCAKAARLAYRWVRIALESAQGEGRLHPGVAAHLTAARAQLEAVEKLLGPASPQRSERAGQQRWLPAGSLEEGLGRLGSSRLRREGARRRGARSA
jgi:hypothetical protein